MSLEFMTGALVLNSITAVLILLLLLALYRIGRAVYLFAVEEQPPRVTLELTYLFIFVFISAVYGTASQPKVAIDVPKSREQIEYEENKEIVIKTPPPRTETLEGFTPLKSE